MKALSRSARLRCPLAASTMPTKPLGSPWTILNPEEPLPQNEMATEQARLAMHRNLATTVSLLCTKPSGDRYWATLTLSPIDGHVLAHLCPLCEETERKLNRLTPRQWHILDARRRGLPAAQVAGILGVTSSAVRHQWVAVCKAWGTRDLDRMRDDLRCFRKV